MDVACGRIARESVHAIERQSEATIERHRVHGFAFQTECGEDELVLQAEVEIAKQGKGNVVSLQGRRVRRWLIPYGGNRSAPDVKCILLIS